MEKNHTINHHQVQLDSSPKSCSAQFLCYVFRTSVVCRYISVTCAVTSPLPVPLAVYSSRIPTLRVVPSVLTVLVGGRWDFGVFNWLDLEAHGHIFKMAMIKIILQ